MMTNTKNAPDAATSGDLIRDRRREVAGLILTIGDGFVIYRADPRGRLVQVEQVAWDNQAGGSHLDAVKSLARAYFEHGTLRRVTSTELPHVGRLWGWTRENRPVGQASILVDHYRVLR